MKRLALFLSVLFFVPFQAFGWGAFAHRAIGQIAADKLTPPARAQVAQLLGEGTLASVAPWADWMRKDGEYQQTKGYHYEKIGDGDTYIGSLEGKSKGQRAKGGAVAAILVADEILRDRVSSPGEKADALKFLVHFVGDIHQPLHTGRPEDVGGIKIWFDWFGKKMSLHKIWDTQMIYTGHPEFFRKLKAAEGAARYAADLEARFAGLSVPADADVEGWLNESLALRAHVYDPSAKTDQAGYQATYLPKIDERVYVAGVRLAGLLNDIFAGGPTPPEERDLRAHIEAAVGDIHRFIRFTP